MDRFRQSPTDPDFVQNPYPFYARLRASGDLAYWEDYDMPVATSYRAVSAILKDRRFGRAVPAELATAPPPHTRPFYEVEAHSMLQLEPPEHTRLRGLVLRAFTSRRISKLEGEIRDLCHELIDRFPNAPFDLLPAYATPIPVILIARLLGVPEEDADRLISWSHSMVKMYQAGRSHSDEVEAADASSEFSTYLRDRIAARRKALQDDLLSDLIVAEAEGDRLSEAELISTVILLLNAGHEATVHTIGNGVKTLIEGGCAPKGPAEALVEEVMRFDPPLHLFTRTAYETVTHFGYEFQRGDEIGLLLASANRDESKFETAEIFVPGRYDACSKPDTPLSLGAGLHFCVGAPLARMELAIALLALFDRCPKLRILEKPSYADIYHFHGLEKLVVGT